MISVAATPAENIYLFFLPHSDAWNLAWYHVTGKLFVPVLLIILGSISVYFYRKYSWSQESGSHFFISWIKENKIFFAICLIVMILLVGSSIVNSISWNNTYKKMLQNSDQPMTRKSIWNGIAFEKPFMIIRDTKIRMPKPIGDISYSDIVSLKLVSNPTQDSSEIDSPVFRRRRWAYPYLLITVTPETQSLIRHDMNALLRRGLRGLRRRSGSRLSFGERIAFESVQPDNSIIIANEYTLSTPRIKELLEELMKQQH